MPTAREKVDVEIEFEMWCEICGSGICATTIYKKNSTNEFTTYCPDCVKDSERKDKEIQRLEEEVEELKQDVKTLERRVEDLES